MGYVETLIGGMVGEGGRRKGKERKGVSENMNGLVIVLVS